MALLIILTKICCIRRLSPTTASCFISGILTLSLCPFSSIPGITIVSILSISSDKLNSSSVSVIFPLSILLISSISLISPNKCLLDFVIFARQSFTFSLSLICVPAIAVIPIIAFIGVLISCDILDRNCVFAALA